MQIIQKIKKLFRKKKSLSTKEQYIQLRKLQSIAVLQENLPDNVVGNIVFSVLDDGNVHIYCQWNDTQVAEQYGEMLFNINEGNYTSNIIDILSKYANTSPQDIVTINKIMYTWQNLISKTRNMPLIQPNEVFSPTNNVKDDSK